MFQITLLRFQLLFKYLCACFKYADFVDKYKKNYIKSKISENTKHILYGF